MCGASETFRALIGIYPYTPCPIPPAGVRKPTRFGARGNGHAVRPLGLELPIDPLIDTLAREQRIIRALLSSRAERNARGRE